MKKLSLLFMVCCTMALLVFTAAASAQPQAICVPWQPSDHTIAHYTYSGAEITLKGIVRGGAITYTWDFGDGSVPVPVSISDPYNLGVKHTYTGIPGQLVYSHPNGFRRYRHTSGHVSGHDLRKLRSE